MSTEEQNENREAIAADVQIVDLENGISYGGNKETKITVRKPNAEALRGVRIADLMHGDVSSILSVLPRVTTPTITKAHFSELEPCDIAQLGGALIYFLQPKSVRVELSQEV